jgi:hypothetical protein
MSKELTQYDKDVYKGALELLKLLITVVEENDPNKINSVRDHLDTKPNCYECSHRREVSGSAHSICVAYDVKVIGDTHGINSGWFIHPFNFDPTWLISCDSFKQK